MFAALIDNGGPGSFDRDRMAASLAAYGAGVVRDGTTMAAGRARCTRRGAMLGWIDKADIPDGGKGADRPDPLELYIDAACRWGDMADACIVGNYAAAVIEDTGSLRLARSPWNAPPLYWAETPLGIVASPLLRVLFAAGVDRRLEHAAIAHDLGYGADRPDTACQWHGVNRVPLGCVVHLVPGRPARIERWYDPLAVAAQDGLCEAGRIARARELLGQAARAAAAMPGAHALALSGGLDSPLVAEALLRVAPGTLRTVTFAPHPAARVHEDAGNLADESGFVRAFAAMHPQLEPHWTDPEDAAFDHRTREIFEASQVFAPGLANIGMHHALHAKARELGCDWVFTATLGNQSFSADGRWGYAEYARRGRLRELWLLLRNRPGDERTMARKLLALALLPNLPPGLRARLRTLVHPGRGDMAALLSPLSAAARAGIANSHWDDVHFGTSRAEAVRADHAAEDGPAADLALAFEEIHGVSTRDVTAYRPLLEFCAGLPTGAFAAGGVERRLAKGMAQGVMPEAQRANRRQARHSADMHWRIGRRRDELLAQCARMREHAWLAGAIDVDRIERLLVDWPDAPGLDIDRDWPRILAVPRAMLAAQFIAFAEGRNRL